MTVRRWVGLLAAASLATAVNAEMLLNPWRGITDLESRVNRREERLQAQIDQYTRAGAFPKVWRSLHSKIREANAFLEREMAKEEQRGVGASVAIVYEDEVVLSKGYGLRLANDSSSKVESTTSFQIGSVTKTFVSIGLAILIEEGKLAWNDSVKKHLPWLELYDKYAEQYLTIGDLAAMNSGLDSLIDLALFFGKYRSDEEQVRALKFVEPAHSLRGGHDYANVNFSILGLVIEAISGKPWEEFLRERIWEPLGMTRTFGSAFEARDDDDISYGHYVCGGKTLGPYSLVDDPETQLVGKEHGNRIAAGSVLSSSDDLATLLRLILNKGVVDGVTILNSTATISEMVTGKYAVNQEFQDEFAIEGHQYFADGNTLASGYGFDYVGHAQWGHAYFDKSGDTTVHVTRTGFAPDAKLGVVVVSNSQTPDGHLSYPLDHIRSYLMGIFLDVPREILEFSYRKWRQGDKLVPQLEGTPACGLRFWGNPSFTPLSDDEQAALAGKYVATTSPGYFESLEILRKEDGSGLAMQYGEISADLHYFSDIDNTTRSFIWSYDPLPQFSLITSTEDGSFDINFGVTFHGPSSD